MIHFNAADKPENMKNQAFRPLNVHSIMCVLRTLTQSSHSQNTSTDCFTETKLKCSLKSVSASRFTVDVQSGCYDASLVSHPVTTPS